jgi:hypothetical protein
MNISKSYDLNIFIKMINGIFIDFKLYSPSNFIFLKFILNIIYYFNKKLILNNLYNIN